MGLLDRFKKKPGAEPSPELPGLMEQLRDGDWQVRRDAARRLGDLGAAAEPAVPVLEEVISDEHGEVCLAASDALSRIRRAAH